MTATSLVDRRRFSGDLLRTARENASLTQEQLAGKCTLEGTQVSRFQVFRAESGRTNPHPDTIKALARALGLKPNDLLDKE